MTVLFGLGLKSVSLLCGVFGKQLMRLGHLRSKSMLRVAGLVIQSALGPIFDAWSCAYAAQSILVLFAGADAVGTVLVSPWFLGEKLTMPRLVGAAAIGAGALVAGLSGPRDELDPTYGLEELSGLLVHPAVILWAMGFFLWVVWCVHTMLWGAPARRGLATGALAGLFAGNSWCMKALVRLFAQQPLLVLFASPVAWCLALGAIVSALTAMSLLLRGTRVYQASFLVPVCDGAQVVSGAASGLVVMGEMQGASYLRLAGFFVGLLGVLAGIFVLYRSEVKVKKKPDKCWAA